MILYRELRSGRKVHKSGPKICVRIIKLSIQMYKMD